VILHNSQSVSGPFPNHITYILLSVDSEPWDRFWPHLLGSSYLSNWCFFPASFLVSFACLPRIGYVSVPCAFAWAVGSFSPAALRGWRSTSMRRSTYPLHVCCVFVWAATKAFACGRCLTILLPRVAPTLFNRPHLSYVCVLSCLLPPVFLSLCSQCIHLLSWSSFVYFVRCCIRCSCSVHSFFANFIYLSLYEPAQLFLCLFLFTLMFTVIESA
jgi:hypothetical protein